MRRWANELLDREVVAEKIELYCFSITLQYT